MAAVCALPAPASAQRAGATGEPGFAVAAAGFESYFKYRLRPGATRAGKLRLLSRSRKPVTVVLRAVDVTTAAGGGLAYGSATPRSIGAWLNLGSRAVTVPAGRAVEVPFTLRIPTDALPGDHLAGLVVYNRAQLRAARDRGGKRGFSLRFLPRLAIAVQTTVPGKARTALTVGDIGLDVRPTSTDVTVLVRNSGETLIRKTGGELTVRRGERVLLRRKVDLDAFVPGTELRYRLPLKGVPARGAYSVSGEFRPQGAPAVPVDGSAAFADKEAAALARDTGQKAIESGPSKLLVALLAGGALALLAMGIALVRMRRRLQHVTAAPDA